MTFLANQTWYLTDDRGGIVVHDSAEGNHFTPLFSDRDLAERHAEAIAEPVVIVQAASRAEIIALFETLIERGVPAVAYDSRRDSACLVPLAELLDCARWQ